MKLRIAANKEHVPSNTVAEHLLPSDAIIAKGKEDPANIRLDLHVVNQT